jgi:hypothetical protein
MKTGWRPLFSPQSAPVARGGFPVRFGAAEDELTLTPHQQLAKAMPSLPTQRRSWNFWDIEAFNQEFEGMTSSPLKLNSYPTQQDFIQLLLKRRGEPTLAYAQAIEQMLTGIDADSLFLTTVLYAMVSDLPYASFLSLVQFKDSLLKNGAIDPEERHTPPRLIYSAYLALKAGAVTPAELRTVVSKLGKLAEKEPQARGENANFGPKHLWLQLLKRYPQEKLKNRNAKLDLEGFCRPIFKDTQVLLHTYKDLSVNCWEFTSSLVKNIPNIQEFPDYIALTRKETPPKSLDTAVHSAYFKIIPAGLPLDTLQAALPILKEIRFVSPGGFSQILGKYCKKATPDEIRHRFSDLPECLRFLSEFAEDRQIFMHLLEELAKSNLPLPDMTDGQRVLQVMPLYKELKIADPRQYIKTFWKIASGNPQAQEQQMAAYRQYLFQPSLFAPYKWRELLDAVADFPFAQRTQTFINALPEILMQNNYSLEQSIISGVQVGIPLEHWDSAYADVLSWSQSPRFQKAERELRPHVLREILNQGMGQILEQVVSPDVYLNAVTDWLLLIPPHGNKNTLGTFATYFPTFLREYPEAQKQIPQLFERLYRYKDLYEERVSPPDDDGPMETLVNRLLMHTPPHQWEDVATAFIEALAKYPWRERNHWDPYNPTPLRTTLIEAHVRSQSHNYVGSYARLLPHALAALDAIQDRMPYPLQGMEWLSHVLMNTQHESEARASLQALVTLLQGDFEPEEKKALAQLCNRPALNKYSIPQRQLILEAAKQFLDIGEPPERIIEFLHFLLQTSDGNLSSLSHETLEDFFQKILNAPPEHQSLRLFLKHLRPLSSLFGEPQLILTAFELLSEFPPEQMDSVAEVLLDRSTMQRIKPSLQALILKNPEAEAARQHARDTLKTFTLLPTPTAMLNHVMMNRETLPLASLQGVYHYVEYGAHSYQYGHSALPELLALLEPYAQQVRQQVTQENHQRNAFGAASAALTRLFNYIQEDSVAPIGSIDSQVFNNWARVGTLGLSFTKWQYDAMTRWKGQGPAQQPPLLVASGQFKPTPPRDSDSRYFGGFVYYEPTSKLHVELRRAYIVVSQPSLGTLVIRNSSPVFGRDLLKGVAYYSPSAVYTQGEDLFNPESDLETKGFQGVLSKQLNAQGTQKGNAQKIAALLDAFDSGMEPYIAWKCGFQDGQAPAGFKVMLESALKSTQSVSPFGKKKNLQLGWVNRYEMPLVTRSFDMSKTDHQAEAAFLLQVLNGQIPPPSQEQYQARMPNLLAFLDYGLTHHLELVLSE